MKEFQSTLIVGKFAPLHLGHELLIRSALARAERVVLISYSNPELPGCEPERRRGWLGARFPQCTRLVLDAQRDVVPANEASDSAHRAFVAQLCSDVLRVDVDAVFTSERYGDGFARALTRHFQQRDPTHPPIVHVCVDEPRQQLPISGSAIRADVHAHRAWLAPEVYASFVRRICVLGGESSGKTSLAGALAQASGGAWVAEYGRELWQEKAGRLELADMLVIARRQVEREQAALLTAHRFVFCDTSALTTAFYSADLFGHVDPELEALVARPYDHYVVCAPDFPFVQDGTRRDASFRQHQHAYYEHALRQLGRPYLLAKGSLDQRVRQVLETLDPRLDR